MPVNSFADYPMSWKPEKERLTSPKYRSLAQLLTEDILSGTLPPHTKLPPQRELADYLDLNLSTITRAFQLCTSQGLLYGITGKGTFVSPNAAATMALADEKEEASYIEMGIIKPLDHFNSYTKEAMKTVLNREGTNLLDYSYPMGTPYQKAAAQKWLSQFSMNPPSSLIAITAGAQNALAIVLISLFRAGDKIATDFYTYSNFMELANMLQIRLVPVAGDEKGILPDALDAQCRLQHIAGLYVIPAFHNPTGHSMDEQRRKDLAAIIQKHQLTVIEDDIYVFLQETPATPMAALAPEQTCYISSLSKAICSGLRVAYITYPERFSSHIRRGIFNINVKVPSLNSETAGELIFSGAAESIIKQKREEAKLRREICHRFFPAEPVENMGFSFWVPLPECFYKIDFEQLAIKNGIHICHSKRFSVGQEDPRQFLRVSLSSPETPAQLEQGLSILHKLFTKETANQDFLI
ncbi:PLP-dependent aminotransferase family protein [Anaerotignum lactatifermentans]|uniref:PLP-dependent aminotransferase family protein n=2 Tax=Anaerotignum lactatifermentans TaxID=160404 RepID=A0ABS2G6S8_9FIRM|nr:PLP-dependent aminotransferase family protein [Anaerotignum lactatifermentans]MBM6877169.1 PLP-dependent aminotransferase family protein [Anaerotignum lactatifermentans]MBM6951407.1 PLP-dependent aminotransferase family protein [Anaerotignum lactatifermentans]